MTQINGVDKTVSDYRVSPEYKDEVSEALREFEHGQSDIQLTKHFLKMFADVHAAQDESLFYLMEVARDTKYKVAENTRLTCIHTKLAAIFLSIIVLTQVGLLIVHII